MPDDETEAATWSGQTRTGTRRSGMRCTAQQEGKGRCGGGAARVSTCQAPTTSKSFAKRSGWEHLRRVARSARVAASLDEHAGAMSAKARTELASSPSV